MVQTTSLGNLFIFERLPCLHEMWTPVVGEILVVKIEPTNRHDIHVTIYRDAKIVGHVPYNLAPRMSAFLMMKDTKRLSKSQEPKSTGELAMVWKSYVSTIYISDAYRGGGGGGGGAPWDFPPLSKVPPPLPP